MSAAGRYIHGWAIPVHPGAHCIRTPFRQGNALAVQREAIAFRLRSVRGGGGEIRRPFGDVLLLNADTEMFPGAFDECIAS